jgi:hypothetical protein
MILLKIPVQIARAIACVLFGTDTIDQQVLAAKGEAQYRLAMGR